MTPPFPPLPPAAPQIVQDWFNFACQKWERELVAKNVLDTLAPDVDPQLKKNAEADYGFAQLITENARQLYIDALERAGYPDEDTRKTA